MNTETQRPRRTTLEVLTVLARWFLGGWFVYMGWIKAMQPQQFLELIREYNVIHNHIVLNAIASLLPWFEIFCGLLLIGGIAVRGTAVALMAMLVPFTALVFRRALDIAATEHKAFCAVRFDCGCGAGEVLICSKLLENSGLMLLACWLLFAHSRRFCLRYRLLRAPDVINQGSDAPALERSDAPTI